MIAQVQKALNAVPRACAAFAEAPGFLLLNSVATLSGTGGIGLRSTGRSGRLHRMRRGCDLRMSNVPGEQRGRGTLREAEWQRLEPKERNDGYVNAFDLFRGPVLFRVQIIDKSGSRIGGSGSLVLPFGQRRIGGIKTLSAIEQGCLKRVSRRGKDWCRGTRSGRPDEKRPKVIWRTESR